VFLAQPNEMMWNLGMENLRARPRGPASAGNCSIKGRGGGRKYARARRDGKGRPRFQAHPFRRDGVCHERENGATHPLEVRLLGAVGVVASAQSLAHVLEKFWFARLRRGNLRLLSEKGLTCGTKRFILGFERSGIVPGAVAFVFRRRRFGF